MGGTRIGGVALAAVLLAAGVAQAEQPKIKSNMFARAKVLSKNALSITIRHSEWGQATAYQYAADHCAAFGKLAVQTISNIGAGADTTTTWVCQEPPKPAPATGAAATPQ